MALISRLCRALRSSPAGVAAQLRKYGAAAATVADYEQWEYAYPFAMAAAEEADGHMVGRGVQWVFIGSPGVYKSAYAAKLANILNVPHISMGSLVREELRMQSTLSKQLSACVSQGKLLPDNIIFKLLSKRLELGVTLGEAGFILDGFPRTRIQAEVLDHVAGVDLAINFKCKEEDKLIKRCLGRRSCPHCGKTSTMVSIDAKGMSGGSRIHMQPVQLQCSCLGKFSASTSDAEENLKEKLRIYSEQSKALEDYYCNQRKLLNFEVPGDIQETWSGLLAALQLKDQAALHPKDQQFTC
uniref:adenylate kinase n=1 Tax=Wollemia nobilis TaxID=56998 RepID=A0A0C9RR25_9CONI